jgi:hypothetical protein
MYYTLWRNGDDFPEPYTFNTNSIDDIRNYLSWEIVDSMTSGEENLKGDNISNYNLEDIEWEKYESSLVEVSNLIHEVLSKCTYDLISNYRNFDTGYYTNPEINSQIFYNIRVSDKFTLVISEDSFDATNCYGENFEHNEFMFGQKPWL